MHSITGGTIADFNSFALGTDLTNDHPIGVQYAANISPALGYKIMDVTNAKMSFFDTNGSTRVDKNEIRVYNTGGVYEVECATCHDPHGVPSGGTGSVFIPAFLRVDNTGSALCLTCHDK